MSDEERSLVLMESPSATPKPSRSDSVGDSETRDKLSPDPAPAKGCENEERGDSSGGCEGKGSNGRESGGKETNTELGKNLVNGNSQKGQVNGNRSEEEESSNGRERRRRRNGDESSSEEDSFADAVDDMQNVADSSEAPPDQLPHEEREERTSPSGNGGTESDNVSASGDSREWNQGSEEAGGENLDVDKDRQDLENSLSYDGEQPEEEEAELGDKSGEEPEDDDDDDDDEKVEEEEISKDSPMYVPKGVYFQHDSRSEEKEDETEAEDQKPKSRSESVNKWEHDLYIEEEQKPRTQWEKDQDHKRLNDWENRRSQGPRSRGTLREYMPSRRRQDNRNVGRYNDRYTPRDRQPNHPRGQQHATEKDDRWYNHDHPQRRTAAPLSRERGPSNQRTTDDNKRKGPVGNRGRGASDQRAVEETKNSFHRNKDRRSINYKAQEESRSDDIHSTKSKEPTHRQAVGEIRKSPRPSRSNTRNESHASASDHGDPPRRRTENDSKELVAELPSLSNSSAPKSLFQQHGETTRSFINSRVFTLDQRSQRVTVKEVESAFSGGNQQSQPSLRVRRPLGRGRGIIKKVSDVSSGHPGTKVGTTTGDTVPATSPPSSEIKEIAPFDQRATDEGSSPQTPKSSVSHPCKTQVNSDRALHETLLSPPQGDEVSPKRGKEKESILGEPPPAVATGKPKRYSSQRQKTVASAQEDLAEEPHQPDYSMSGPNPWMLPYLMMDPASIQRHTLALMQQQLAQQMAFFQPQPQQPQQLRVLPEYQQAAPPPPPPVGPHNPTYPMEMPPPMMPYLPPIPPQAVPPHPEAKVPMVPVPMGAEGFAEQGGLFIPGMNPEQQRFYHSPGAVPKHSQAIPIVPPTDPNL